MALLSSVSPSSESWKLRGLGGLYAKGNAAGTVLLWSHHKSLVKGEGRVALEEG